MEEKNQKTQDLYKKREYYRNQFFILGLEIIVYFSVPAALGIFLGKKLDAFFDTRFTFLIISLVVAYSISWIIFFIRVRYVKKALAKANEDIKNHEGLEETK